MEKIKYGRFPYNLLKPAENNRNGFAAILYHGWGTTADSYTGLAEKIAEKGYIVIIPEIVYHDSRNPLTNWFDKKVIRKYFWKTIVESIEEFEEFFQGLGIAKEKTLLIGSSMGGFIANGIFSFQKDLGGLVNINGSGSFVLTEKLFRERDGRPALTAEEEAFLSQFDPVQKEKCASPVLLMHGDQDTTIPIAGQERYFQHLKEKEGRENAKFLIFPGVNHQITEAVVERLLNWLEEVQKMQVWRTEMTKELVVEILNWRYAEPYDFYNNDVTEEGLQ
ncbi:alpha/beta hydrolase family protein [Planomicrobium sp. CPCC 101079]|uniref:alpha/beta hydrolase family protein n=1 Tax=Planomicrobium sp. CPCC 101079 TaxID=2599618 RepID=UPI00351A08F6